MIFENGVGLVPAIDLDEPEVERKMSESQELNMEEQGLLKR